VVRLSRRCRRRQDNSWRAKQGTWKDCPGGRGPQPGGARSPGRPHANRSRSNAQRDTSPKGALDFVAPQRQAKYVGKQNTCPLAPSPSPWFLNIRCRHIVPMASARGDGSLTSLSQFLTTRIDRVWLTKKASRSLAPPTGHDRTQPPVFSSPWRKSQPTHSRRAYPSEMGQFQEFRTAQTASKDFCHGLLAPGV
jgi:hypothetical protein